MALHQRLDLLGGFGRLADRQYRRQILACVRAFGLRHHFRCAAGDDAAATVATFWAQVDDVVGGFDHIQIVLNDDNAVAFAF